MARTAVTIGFSVPPATADLVERIAAREGRSKSELFRDMVRVYSEQRELEVFEEFAAYGVAKGAQVGARGEADTERAVAQAGRDVPAGMDTLSASERIQLAEDLWDSVVAANAEIPLTAGEVEVLDSRLDDLERHPDSAKPWEEVRARLQERARRGA